MTSRSSTTTSPRTTSTCSARHPRPTRRQRSGTSDLGASFAVWAQRGRGLGDRRLQRLGSDTHHLAPVRSSGIWAGRIEGARVGDVYKFHLRSRGSGYRVDKADPSRSAPETPPRTGSILWDLSYDWGDDAWLDRDRSTTDTAPMSIYEVHLGSWRRRADGGWLELPRGGRAARRPRVDLGFTHVEFLPVMEHPFYGSWGYQTTGYFAPTARFGTPQDLMFLIDHLHQRGLGVILDWVPSHFPTDEHGLAFFDGTHLYEHADPRRGYHPDWHTLIFNYGRDEVRSFLLSSADHWLRTYHADGLRWTRSRRCSTSTTRGRPASGSPTSSAGGRTWRRWRSSGA